MQKNVFISILFTCAIFYTGFSQQMKIRLNHSAIYVTDLQVSAAFYQNIIGLESIP